MKQKRYIFIGERPSKLAAERKWTWTDGRLAAKQLFEGLIHCGIDPRDERVVRFFNIYEKSDSLVENHNLMGVLRREREWIIVGMGAIVQEILTEWHVPHLKMIHPAARGTIRKKENWYKHVAEVLSQDYRSEELWQKLKIYQ